jgi:hypothetical protein
MAATVQTTTTFAWALKTLWPQSKVLRMLYEGNPTLAMIKKSHKFTGKNIVISVIGGEGGGGEVVFATAQSQSYPATGKDFTLTRKSMYAVRHISNEAIEASQMGDTAALINALKLEGETAVLSMNNKLGKAVFGVGDGKIGSVDTPSASTTLTLENPEDISNFFVGQVICFAADNTSALRDTGATLTVSAINESAGTMVVSANVSTISGITDGDLIFQNGVYVTASDRGYITGFDGWNPLTAPTTGDSFFGQDRSTHVTRYSGYRFTNTGSYAGYGKLDAVKLMARMVARGGQRIDKVAFSPNDMDDLINDIEGKVQYSKITVPITSASGKVVAEVGFDSVKVHTPAGTVECYPDRNLNDDSARGFKDGVHELFTLGDTVKWVSDVSGAQARTRESADGVELRLVSRGQMGCHAPGATSRFDWS